VGARTKLGNLLDKIYGKIREIAESDDELIERPLELSDSDKMKDPSSDQSQVLTPKLVEGTDFYWEGNYMVLTEIYLLKRGYCCKSGCRHCPYGFKRK
jgi:hypothetical protein